jgi:hypothetical protein
MHTYRIARRRTLLEVEPVEGEVPQKVQQEEPEGERPAADLPECPNH